MEVYNASQSQATQNNQVEAMAQDGCDIICVNLVDRTDPTTVIDLAEKNDIPVIFFNRELVEEDLERWDKLYYVGAKAFESGMMEGQIAAAAFYRIHRSTEIRTESISMLCLRGSRGIRMQ